jgi:hypothetical protein
VNRFTDALAKEGSPAEVRRMTKAVKAGDQDGLREAHRSLGARPASPCPGVCPVFRMSRT